ncbi:MAG TPA: hypothetical protein VKV26_05965 [Dehalococcoidia bacterium]|nr:hypothetical protein [Dehalococcoidia bacterium]
MEKKGEPHPRTPTAEELRHRLVGRSLERDEEDIEFWRTASEQVRGEALYELLAQTERIPASLPVTHPETERLMLRKGGIERLTKP